MMTVDTRAHVRGESPYVDDLPEPSNLLYGAIVTSTVANGMIDRLDCSAAEKLPGVVGVLTASDIPGENQIGGIIDDETLFAEKEVHYIGQPIGLVVAKTAAEARAAVHAVELQIQEKEPVLDPRKAADRGSLICPARTIACGDIEKAWSQCTTIVSGCAESGGQEHLYLETQVSMAIPDARGHLKLYAGTQSPSGVQRQVARVLGYPMHEIEVEVQRLGGAFGGKEEQATPWACMASLAAVIYKQPVKVALRRHEDIRMTGKRHPYSTDYRLGLDSDGKFVAFEATYYQNSGAAADLSPAIMERTLFHATGSYYVPNVSVTALCCRTNLPPNTAFRGFGGPQGAFVIEAAITAAAKELYRPTVEIQQKNLLCNGHELPFGMCLEGCTAERSFKEALSRYQLEKRRSELDQLNAESPLVQYGLAVMPMCFGISFTNKMLNQAGALVNIYTDGSVSVSTAAVEMGQGVFSKIRQIAAETLGVSLSRVRIENTNTTRVPNMSPTAASTATDLNGMAVQRACQMLNIRLQAVAVEILGRENTAVSVKGERVWVHETKTEVTWAQLISTAYCNRVDLSAHAFYATPGIDYDKQTEKGRPFAYHVFGTAITEVRLDVLRGTASIESVRVVHDAGRSIAPEIDMGQLEGALVQGIGWMTMEDVVYNDKGRLLSNSLATYKVPDFHFAPEIEAIFLPDSINPHAVMQTKGIGEPPFLYGIGAYFAILDAIQAVRDVPTDLIQAPMTHERILNLLDGIAPEGSH